MLKIVCDYLDENNYSYYLLSILMKNKFGYSAIDLAILNESPKTTEIFLDKLCKFEDLSLSSLFFDKFPLLFKMKLESFNNYLETCVF